MNISSQSTRFRSFLNNSDKMAHRKKRKVFELPASYLSAANGTDCCICLSLFCFVFPKVSVLFWIITFSWNTSISSMVWKKKKNSCELEYSVEYSGLHSSVKLSWCTKQCTYISGPKVLKMSVLPLYSCRSVIAAVLLAYIA